MDPHAFAYQIFLRHKERNEKAISSNNEVDHKNNSTLQEEVVGSDLV